MSTTKEVAKSAKPFDPAFFLAQAGMGGRIVSLKKGQIVFSQGERSGGIFYIQRGKVKLSVVSPNGKDATVAILGAGEFLGEESVANVPSRRRATASALAAVTLLKIDRKAMMRALHEHRGLSELFVAYLLSRNLRIQEDLVDQLFNFTEKRLARTLLLLAQVGGDGVSATVIPRVSQATLAEMIGTTRSRVNFFMNRFRKMGFIEYNGQIRVHSSLLNVVLHD